MRRSPTVRDEEVMAEALAEAEKSLLVDEFPVGAVVVLDDEVVARAHWVGASRLRLLDHAELVALLEAERCEGRSSFTATAIRMG